MTRRVLIRYLLLTAFFAALILPSCIPQSASQATLKSVWISAIAVPDFDVSDSMLDNFPGAVPFNIHLYVDPSTPGTDDDPDPIFPTIGFVSDGLCYSQEYTADLVTKAECASGDDVCFVYSLWIQTVDENDDSGDGRRCWYKSFSIDSSTSSILMNSVASSVTSEEDTSESHLNLNNGLLTWEVDTSEDYEDMLQQYVFVPITPICTLNLAEPDDGEIDETSKSISNLGESLSPNLTITRKSDGLTSETSDCCPNEDIVVVPEHDTSGSYDPTGGYITFDEVVLDEELMAAPPTEQAYKRFPHGFDLGARYPESSEEGTSTEVLGIPIYTASLFSNEPQIIALPYTFWVDINGQNEYPEDQSEGWNPQDPGEYIPQHDLEVIASPPHGGTVELFGNGRLIEPDSEPEVDEGDPSGWEVKQRYQWTLFGKASQTSDKKFYKVNLKAVPFEGYRFVAWVGEGIEIENPEAISISLQVPTKELRYATEGPEIPRVYAYFARIIEEPQDEESPPPQETIYVSFDGRGQCTATQSMCSCNLSISIEGKDLTNGSYPVTNVTLTVNGDVWHDSGSISETSYIKTIEKTVDCDKTFDIEVTTTNSIGQSISSTGSVTTARP
ncbi:MAG: hypothetical protein JSV32_04630 [Dehalococcoidia bacterium]|nr:MAG: hypothetical protein JSV32_04630 [Dehalococcoidia bacterium]